VSLGYLHLNVGKQKLIHKNQLNNLCKEVIKWCPAGRRKRGRPKLNLGGRD
jgi:hypothetical protein